MVKRNELLTPLNKTGNGVGYSLASNSSDLSTHIHGRDQRGYLGDTGSFHIISFIFKDRQGTEVKRIKP